MNEDVLSIRFEGRGVLDRSAPIYELGTTLVALQRIIYKTSQFQTRGTVQPGTVLSPRRREELGLRISRHTSGSDLWGLRPYLTDPALGPIFQGIVVLAVGAIGAYVAKRVFKGEQQPHTDNAPLVLAIFAEVKQISDRVDTLGRIENVEITSPSYPDVQPVRIDSDTRDYVRGLDFNFVRSNREMTISGLVTRIYPQSYRLDLSDAPGHYIRVRMSPELFERVRRMRELTENEIKLVGYPSYRVGDDVGRIREFNATKLVRQRRKPSPGGIPESAEWGP